MASEQDTQQRIRLALSKGPVRLFRNNVAKAWSGSKIERQGRDVLVRNARPIQAGLAVGSADLIGWKTIEITPDMVGQRVAVFASLEIKSDRGRLRPEQVVWQELTQEAGALSGVARSIPDAQAVLDGRLLV